MEGIACGLDEALELDSHAAPHEADHAGATDDRGNTKRKQDDDRNDDEQKDGNKGNGDKKDEKPPSHWPIYILIALVVLAVVGGSLYWFMTRNEETTDDAYTEGNAVSIAAHVSGYIVERDVDDNSFVKAGDLMLRIDPRDFVASRDQAKANLELAEAELASAEVDLVTARVRAPANLQQAEAQLDQAEATRVQAERNFHRVTTVDPLATTATNIDQAQQALRSYDASVSSAKAQVSIASLVKETIQTAEDTVSERKAQVAQVQASLEQAELNLSYTQIRAPQDGLVTRRNVDVGTYAQAGQQVFYLVPNDIWVVANFKETQLARMRIGQQVDISVDAYPQLALSGHIQSIQGGSGARFTTFPAENATGNFVKIVRRVPVKILIDQGLDRSRFLPLGLSVAPTVYLK